MTKFAKLFEFDTNQVLVEKSNNSEELGLVLKTDLGFGMAHLTIGFSTEEELDEAFDAYTSEDAGKFLNNMQELIEE